MSRMQTRIRAGVKMLILFGLFQLLINSICALEQSKSNTDKINKHQSIFKNEEMLKSKNSNLLGKESLIVSKSKYLPDCSSEDAIRSRNLFLISTLDGNLSAIDAIGGKVLWTSRIAETLLSSSISDFMVNAIGETVRIVPSLDGNLFVHNGKTLKQTQYSAEKLLKKSLKFSENIILVGGKDSQALGIDLNTGEIVYECGLKGCTPDNDYSRDNIIVLRRNFQSIRAINIANGVQDWHYQVNDPEVLTVSKPNCQGTHYQQHELSNFRIDYKIIIPCGIIRTQVYRNNQTIETLSHQWSHKFGLPIVKFWHLKDGKVSNVDLFDQNIIEISDVVKKNEFQEPQLYIGSYKNQLYVQKSHHYRETLSQVQDDQTILVKKDVLNEKNTAIIQVQWKPKLVIDGPSSQLEIDSLNDSSTQHEMASVSGFPFLAFNREDSTGYYVFRTKNQDELCDRLPNTDNVTNLKQPGIVLDNDEPIQQIYNIVINNSLSFYWKEVLAICLVSGFVFHHVWGAIKSYIGRRWFTKKALEELEELLPMKIEPLIKKIEHEISVQTDLTTSIGEDSKNQTEIESPKFVIFNSRFYEDFNPVSQLGKGGFGVVFEAQHKIDGQRYAVKRVAMPTKEQKREKFMREVRFLSNLEHPGIVRYYNAWIEEPPPGWQDEKDEEWSFEFSKMDTYLDASGSRSETGSRFYNDDYQDDSLISFRNDGEYNDNDSDSLISFRNDDSDNNLRNDYTSGSESDDEEDSENDKTSNFNAEKSDSGSDIFVFKHKTSGLECNTISNINRNVSVINKHTKNSSISGSKMEKRIDKKKKKKNKNDDDNVRTTPDSKSKIYVYIQMQLCKKITLKDWLMDTELRKQSEWLQIFTQILSAVDYVHDKKLIHRDLKPSNIFFSMDDTVKIGDFGLVTSILDDSFDSSEEETQLGNKKKELKHVKHTNEVGTHIYMSPEQIKKQPYNHKVDIFSIGIILYELLQQFGTESERFRKLECVRRKDFPIEFQQKYEDECKILHKLLSLNPDERPEAKQILQEDMFQNRSRNNSHSY